MIYTCCNCGQEVAGGCLPSATCGTLFVALFGFWLGCMPLFWRLCQRCWTTSPVPPSAVPWWAWLLIVPAALIGAFALMLATHWLLALLEWLLCHLYACPDCGRRRWSWGATRGFGL